MDCCARSARDRYGLLRGRSAQREDSAAEGVRAKARERLRLKRAPGAAKKGYRHLRTFLERA